MATKRSQRRTLHVEIRAVDLPGRRCFVPEAGGITYDDVHVGIQKEREVIERVRADAKRAQWAFEVEVDDAGDYFGAYVQGKKGDRFFYLSWGTVDAHASFTSFRRAKLMLDAAATPARAALKQGGTLVAELPLTMANGTPVCAAVRPPKIRWSSEAR